MIIDTGWDLMQIPLNAKGTKVDRNVHNILGSP